jgi:hypothetical protein
VEQVIFVCIDEFAHTRLNPFPKYRSEHRP